MDNTQNNTVKNIQNIKDRLNTSLNTLIDMEEYEHCQKVKNLIDKVDYFISLRDKIEDKDLYERMEKMLIEMCQN
jgi:hypothetical protein